MTQYIFMNEQIRKEKPSRPVIVLADDFGGEDLRQREANEFELWVLGQKIGRVVYDPKTLKACKTHEVKAWVELDDIVIVCAPNSGAPAKPVARAKRPHKRIIF